MRGFNLLIIFIMLLGILPSAEAHVNPEDRGRIKESQKIKAALRADCAEATAQTDLNANNVRARLLTGGDVWWDLDEGMYVVPNVATQPVSALFAGSVWLGGISDAGQLKTAAQTYRQGGNDYWPGPLVPNFPSIPQNLWGTVEPDTCLNWDRFFKVSGESIRQARQRFEEACGSCGSAEESCQLSRDDVSRDMLGWPGRGNPFFEDVWGFELPDTDQGLAGFWDCDLDGEYNPLKGDYPIVEVRGCDAEPSSFPEEMIFWIYNDAGGIHTETQGELLRMEVQVQAFAYESNDELNDMTFYRYKLINRASESIDSTYFAMWVDPDLGCYQDDFIGCNISRSLSYVYNADDNDQDCAGVRGYGLEVPMLGVDYFRGPLGPFVLSEDSTEFLPAKFGQDPDTILELGMSSFTYFNNNFGGVDPNTTDPQVALEFYRYLSGSWRDGTPFTFGGIGYNPNDPNAEPIDYAFPDNPSLPLPAWSMSSEGLAPADRRTVQASGPFRLDPGATNELIIGAVFVPDVTHPAPDASKLFFADDIAQNLFDACFIPVDGPDAPDVCFIELDRELVAVFTNDEISNNFNEAYTERPLNAIDTLPDGTLLQDSLYEFEGYKLYQLAGPEVTNDDLDDPEQSRLIFQVDVRNGIGQIFNWEFVQNPTGENPLPVPVLEVDGSDDGVRHTFRITEDQFSTGTDKRLINHRKYYFRAVAYAYNNFFPFNPDPDNQNGQDQPYLEGRRNIQTYAPIPRPITDRSLNAMYGEGPVVTRLDGVGGGGAFLDISDEQRDAFFEEDFNGEITYQPGEGPVNVFVYNPLDALDGDFILRFSDEDPEDFTLQDSAFWSLENTQTGEVIFSDRTIQGLNEQIIPEFGYSVSIDQRPEPFQLEANNGAIGAEFAYADPAGPQWFTGFADDVNNNYIKTDEGERDFELDPDKDFTLFGGGDFVPYYLCDWEPNALGAYDYVSPAWLNTNGSVVRQRIDPDSLNNVDVVFTSDKSKWSRCIIVETAPPYAYDFSGLGLPAEADETTGCDPIQNFDLRGAPSVGKDDNNGDGLPDPDGAVDEDGEPLIGMGWFPGYAVDVETGDRLNIFFGENSTYSLEYDTLLLGIYGLDEGDYDYGPNGRDMLYNPNDQGALNSMNLDGNFAAFAYALGYLGGQHFVYVTKQKYDECARLYGRLKGCQSSLRKVNALEQVTWTSISWMNSGTQMLPLNEGLIPNDLVVKLRVENAFQTVKEKFASEEHGGYPTYRINFTGVAPNLADTQAEYDKALDQINVVPNPYFATSIYEDNANASVVKITNLPAKCTVTIYSLDGRFIRQYVRDESPTPVSGSNPGLLTKQFSPAISWDLNNARGIPISSGVYLIHIDAGSLGERVVKWFGVNRSFDATGL